MQRVIKSLPATAIHVPVETPTRLAVVKPGPHRSYNEFVGMFGFHVAVKVPEIIFAPIAAGTVPAIAGVYPGIEAIEIAEVFLRGLIFVDQDGWLIPGIHRLP